MKKSLAPIKMMSFSPQVLKQGQSPKSQGRRLAVTGEPGAGKTTLLQKIAHWVAAETERDVAIWVSLADLQEQNVEEYLLQKWLKDALGEVEVTLEIKKALALQFKSGRVWLLLDGVDEMAAGGNPLATVAAQITGWVAQGRVVVTCRQNVWDAGKNALEGFDVYRNLDFDYPDGVGQFIQRWFARHPDSGERLLAKLAQAGKERIRDTVRNPLRLALLCRAWQIRQGGLPETKAGLYGQFAEALYEWKQEAFPTTSQQRRELKAGLGRLALRGMEQSESRFRLREGLVTEILGETDEPLCQLALQLGWLNLVGVAVENPDERVYAFYHPTFQEYFAALTVDDWGYFFHHVPDNPSLGTYRIFEKQWKEVILLWFGRENVEKEKKEEFIEKLVKFDDGCGEWSNKYDVYKRSFYEYRAYFLAAAVINEFKECSLCEAIVEQIIKWGFGWFSTEQLWLSFFSSIANDSRTVLRETIREKANANLIELLENTKDKSTRLHVIIFLEEITKLGNELVIRQLIQLLRATKHEDIHSLIASILVKITVGNELAIGHFIGELIRVLEITNNQKTRRTVASILEKIAPENQLVIMALIRVLETANNKWTCGDIASSLEKIAVGNELAIRQLIGVLKTTMNKDILNTICFILGKIAVGDELAIEELVHFLETTEDKYTCSSATSTLGEIAVGNELAIMALIRFLETTEDEDTEFIWLNDTNWLLNIASGLEKIAVGNELAIRRLFRFLKTTMNEDIIDTICSILGKIAVGNSLAIKELVWLLETTEYEDNRRKYASILGKIDVGNELGIKELVRLLETTEYEDNRGKVASSLGEIAVGNELAIQVLIRVLETTDNQNYRWNFAHSLEKIAVGNELAIRTLIQALKTNKEPAKCWIFCCILKRITVENELGIQDLIQILGTIKHDEFKIGYVVEILGKIALQKNELAITELVRLLETTDDEDTRRNVASVLGKIAPKNHKLAIRALIRVLETTDDENTRKNVAYNLGGIAPGNNNDLAIRALIRVLETTDDEETRTNFAFRLCLIAPGNELAIRELIQVLETTDDYQCRQFIVWNLGEIKPGNELAIRALIRVLETNKNKDTRVLATSSLEKIAVGNDELAIRGLIRVLETGDNEDVLLSIEDDEYAENYYINSQLIGHSLEKIAVGNELAIQELIRLLQSSLNRYSRTIIAHILEKIAVGNKLAIVEFLRLLKTSCIQNSRRITASMLGKMVKTEEQYIDVVTTINYNLFRSLFFQDCYELLWQCAENLPYPKFYQAWHHQLTSTHPESPDHIPVSNTLLTQSFKTQINDLLTQLQPTTQTYPLPINIQSLADETDTSAICQELCTLIYSLALPDTDIPTASNFAQLKQHILTAKRQLQKRHLALILHDCSPHPPLLTCCRKIADANLGLHVVWITDEPLEPPLRGFPPSQNNLLGVIQTWLEEC